MNVVVNNENKTLQDHATIVNLLTDLSLAEGKGIAVAINNKVVPKQNWETQSLNEQDKITIIKATQGG